MLNYGVISKKRMKDRWPLASFALAPLLDCSGATMVGGGGPAAAGDSLLTSGVAARRWRECGKRAGSAGGSQAGRPRGRAALAAAAAHGCLESVRYWENWKWGYCWSDLGLYGGLAGGNRSFGPHQIWARASQTWLRILIGMFFSYTIYSQQK